MKRIRAVHFGKFYPPHRGGMESVVATLCRGLAIRGVDCRVLVAADRHGCGESVDRGVHVHAMRRFGTLLSTPICPEAAWALRGVRADVLHLHHPNPLADVGCLLSGFEGPVVVTYHSDVVRQRRTGRLYGLLLRRTLQRADAIVATSSEYADSSAPLQPFRDKVRVIPLGLTDVPDAPERPPFAGGEPQYLFVGRLVGYKGLRVLLDALRSARGRLWVIGTGPLEAPLREHARRAGMASRVEFLGNVDEAEKWRRIAACDALVLPSLTRAEAFGVVLLEAMAMGRPVVATDLPTGVCLLVRDGVNGYRVTPGDAEALAATLDRLAADPTLARRMGEQGRQLLHERWTAGHMVEQHLHLYRKLCGMTATAEAPCAS